MASLVLGGALLCIIYLSGVGMKTLPKETLLNSLYEQNVLRFGEFPLKSGVLSPYFF